MPEAPAPAAAPVAAGAAVSSTFEELLDFVPLVSFAAGSFFAAAASPPLSLRTFLSESSFLPVPTPLTFETSSHVL